jgi:drug/metabolite transporter (DMT)-like permease
MALEQGAIDPSSFTAIRLLSGAITLVLIVLFLQMSKAGKIKGASAENVANALSYSASNKRIRFQNSDWISGLSLFVYAAGFSFAYITLPAGTGALILFAAVQITMLGVALVTGARFSALQWLGFILAIIGLVYLFLPGISAPPIIGSLVMMIAGIAWGVYSIKGKKVHLPTLATTENFVRSLPFCIVLILLSVNILQLSTYGIVLAVASGAITSGIGYAIWYAVLPSLKSASAATLQLTVPVIATVGGILWLDEELSLRLILSSCAILGGVAMVVLSAQKQQKAT